MTTDQMNALYDAAKAVGGDTLESPSPWTATLDDLPMVWDNRGDAIVDMGVWEGISRAYFEPDLAAYIASANPAVVIELIERVRFAEAKCQELLKAIEK